MKFSRFNTGQLGLILALSVFTTACEVDEYFLAEERLTGEDAFCYENKDIYTCERHADRCQPAFMESSHDADPLFVACIANPDYTSPTTGDNSNGDDPNYSDGTGDGSNGTWEAPPTIREAYRTNCQNLDEKYLWTKTEVYKKKGSGKQKVNKMSKVKVCHQTGNGYSHTIVIACPALKAHIKHADYLGACEL